MVGCDPRAANRTGAADSEILWDRDFPLNDSEDDMVIMPSNAVPNVVLSWVVLPYCCGQDTRSPLYATNVWLSTSYERKCWAQYATASDSLM